MDPFNEVHNDCCQQVKNLEGFLGRADPINEDIKSDFKYSFQDLQETLADLTQAVEISEQNPVRFHLTEQDIKSRKARLIELRQTIESLEQRWNNKCIGSNARDVTTMSNRISQDFEENLDDGDRIDSQFDKFQQQEYLEQQDFQLDSIHETMKQLNQQAVIMGSELEDQAYILDDLDNHMDDVGNRLQRGLKRVTYVIEKNREKASDWCIGILIVVLIVLLVLLVVA